MIVSKCPKENSRKTVAIITKVFDECENRKMAITYRDIFDRLVHLVDSGVLESFGDLSNWRRSEVRLFSAERGPLPDERRRIRKVNRWLGELRLCQLRNEISGEDAISRVQSELQDADTEDRLTLALNLNMLLTEAGRYDEALQLIDEMIAQVPDNVKFPIAKASLYFYRLNEPGKALEAIDFALKRAFRSKFFRREALGEKARMLLRLGRSKELGQVLEQIMALKIAPGTPDVVRQRDFIDDAPAGLISDDIVARYDKFCPKPVDDLAEHELPNWTPFDEELWAEVLPKDLIVSTDGEDALAEADRWWTVHKWVRQLREEMSIDEVIDRVKARLQNENAEEQFDLERELYLLLKEAYRHDEVLQLIDQEIERKPDRVRPLIWKASFIHWDREDPREALKWIDLALERAHRTKCFRREALGCKARMLDELCHRDRVDCGEELGQVLEEIMALDMYRDFPDIGKERGFVDCVPPGMIREDILARYNKFFPKHDRVLALHRWADQMLSSIQVEEAVARVRLRLQSASTEDVPTLFHILGLLLTDAEQYDEALSWFDMVITRDPDHVRSAIARAMIYRGWREDPEKALEAIEVALERAFRTRFYRRHALGEKARILLKLRRGDELGQVLEQIMSLQMFSDVRDIGRERDFVDQAPPGLIAANIVTRYDEFCPTISD